MSLKLGDTSDAQRPAAGDTTAKTDPPVTTDTVKTTEAVRRKAPPPLEPGVIVDRRYEIESCVGEGGSGFVFRAFDRTLGQRIALKVLHPDLAGDKSWIKRLKREVKVAREIQHPNVCRVFDLGHADGHWFLTMEYAAGGSFRQVLDARSMMLRPLQKIAEVSFASRFADAQAVCAGVAAIHSVGIVHRDITPGNVLRMEDDRLVITDFGLAIRAKDTTTFHGGTPKYMAPELLERKPADQRSDVWQLGYLIHEIIFDRHPQWTHSGDRVVLRSPAHELSTPAERAIADLCIECLSHNPDTRPKNAVEVAGRLAAARMAQPAPPITRLMRSAGVTVRRPVVRRLAVLAGLLGLAIALSRPLLRSPPPDPLLARAAAVWNQAQRYEVQLQFLRELHERPHAVDTLRLLEAAITDHLAKWTTTYREITRRAGPTPGAPAVRCLEDDLDGVAALVSLLQGHAGVGLIDEAPYAVATLREPARCARASTAPAIPRPAPGTTLSAEVERIRHALLVANPLMEGEHLALEAPIIEPLVQAAKSTGFCPVIAEALLAEAHAIGRGLAPNPTYRATLEDALWEAERCGHDRIVAMAAGELAFADRFSPEATSEKWARMADSVLKRLGGDAAIESWLENNRAIAANSQGRYDDAIAGYQRALDLKRSEVGPEHLEYAIRLMNLSDALKGAGHLDQAVKASDSVLQLLPRWLPPDHIEMGVANNNRGDVLLALNRTAEAAAAYTDALNIFRTALSAGDIRLAYPLAGLGATALAQGDHQRARLLLEQAVGYHVTGDVEFAGQLNFALARALLADGGDRAQALALARAARATYGTDQHFSERRDQIDTWLAAQGRRRESTPHRRPLAPSD